MKTILLKLSVGITAIFFLGILLYSCEESTGDENGDELADSTAVQKCIVPTATYTDLGDGEEDVINFTYDSDKRLIEIAEVDEGDTESYKFTYNSDGQIVKFEFFDNGVLDGYEDYVYVDGKLSEVLDYEEGVLDDREVYIYNDGSDYPYRSEKFYSVGEMEEYTEFTADANGNLTSYVDYEKDYESGEFTAWWRATFTYDTEEYNIAYNNSVRFMFDEFEAVIFDGNNRRATQKYEYFDGTAWVVEYETTLTYTVDDDGKILSVSDGDEGMITVTYDCE